MSISLSTYDAARITGAMPLGKPFLAALERPMQDAMTRVKRGFEVYDLTVGRIIKQRNAALPEGVPPATWGYADWTGLHVHANLGKTEGFDSEFIFDAYQRISERTKFEATRMGEKYSKIEPEADVYAELKRRAFVFWVGEARCTLMVFAHSESTVCKIVEDGVTPKYKLVCEGSPL